MCRRDCRYSGIRIGRFDCRSSQVCHPYPLLSFHIGFAFVIVFFTIHKFSLMQFYFQLWEMSRMLMWAVRHLMACATVTLSISLDPWNYCAMDDAFGCMKRSWALLVREWWSWDGHLIWYSLSIIWDGYGFGSQRRAIVSFSVMRFQVLTHHPRQYAVTVKISDMKRSLESPGRCENHDSD